LNQPLQVVYRVLFFLRQKMGLDSHCDLNVGMLEILGDFQNRPLEQDEMDAWRVSLAVDGDVLLDIGLCSAGARP